MIPENIIRILEKDYGYEFDRKGEKYQFAWLKELIKDTADVVKNNAYLKTRYFIVNFFASTNTGETMNGFTDIVCEKGFLNCTDTINIIKERTKDVNKAIITNIIELTKEEYENWTSK